MGWLSGSDANDTRAVEARVKALEDQVAQLWHALRVQGQQPDRPTAGHPVVGVTPATDSAVGGWTQPPEPVWSAQAHHLKAQGRKLEAIKLVRQHTHWGLKESIGYVDGL